MTTTQITNLQNVLDKLNQSDRAFAASLIHSYHKYGKLTERQAPWVEKLYQKAVAPYVEVPVVNLGGFEGVVALFNATKGKLKFPKIRLSFNGNPIVLALAGPKSKYSGLVIVTDGGKYPYTKFYGTVDTKGSFTPRKWVTDEFKEGLVALLTKLAVAPAETAKEHGKLTGNCCFCNKALGLGKEKRSVLVGFGPDCAEHYGLKAEWLAAANKVAEGASAPFVDSPHPSNHVYDNVIVSDAVFDDTVVNTTNADAFMHTDYATLQKKIAKHLEQEEDDKLKVVLDEASSPGHLIWDVKDTQGGTITVAVSKDPIITPDGIPATCYLCEKNPAQTIKEGFGVCNECAQLVEA